MEPVINETNFDSEEGKRKREAELLQKIQKSKLKKGNDGEVTIKKKPGRKRLEVTELNTKKEKNRVAQRAWREKKERYVAELEKKIVELENAKNKSESEKEQLKIIIEKLRSENTYLKNTTSFIFTPTKETEMFMEQNKLKILQQKNLNQNNQALLNNSVLLGTNQSSINPELINEQLPSNGINENLLSNSNSEILDELYKLVNIQNSELMPYQDNNVSQKNTTIDNQESGSATNLITTDAIINSTSSLPSDLVLSNSNNNILTTLSNNNTSTSSSLYDIITPKDTIVVPSNFEMNSTIPTTSTTDPNLLLYNTNDPNQVLMNQQLNSINSNILNSTNPEVLQNTLATLNNQALNQNSLLEIPMLNNVTTPSTIENIQPSTMATMNNIQGINNNLYTLSNAELSGNLSKPIMVSGSMDYRSEVVKEKSQPISDDLFSNMIHILHQEQNNVDGIDKEDLLINQINQNAEIIYNNSIINGIPSPSNTVISGKENVSTPENIIMNTPYTPEEFDSESNRSGEGKEIKSRSISVHDESNSTHSTLQFPAEQKPTKLNIPYSVFPRVTQETVDGFVSESKITDEDIENLCAELKDKATCEEKLKYITKNVEAKGWSMEEFKIKKMQYFEKKRAMQQKEAMEKELKNAVEVKDECI